MGDGSGAKRTIHVKFIVDPLFKNKSGPPRISVIGSVVCCVFSFVQSFVCMMYKILPFDLQMYIQILLQTKKKKVEEKKKENGSG